MLSLYELSTNLTQSGSPLRLDGKHSTTTDPRYHGNKIWDQIGHNSACIGNIATILTPSMGFTVRGRTIEFCQSNSTTTDPRCHGNEIRDKIGYNSACIGDMSEVLASNRVYWGYSCRMMLVKFYDDRSWNRMKIEIQFVSGSEDGHLATQIVPKARYTHAIKWRH